MTKRIKTVKKKKQASKASMKAKHIKVQVVKHGFNSRLVSCITCKSTANLDILNTLSYNDEYFVPICLFCHPVKTNSNVIIDDEGRLKRFMEKYNE